MRIQIMSDLHLEFYAPGAHKKFLDSIQTDADVLVLAGDVLNLRKSDLRWSHQRMGEFCSRYSQVVYIPGNHEFYGASIAQATVELSALERFYQNLTVLRAGEVRVVNDQRFLGSTMWYPPGDEDTPTISDHYAIQDLAPLAYQEHKDFKTGLDNLLREDDIVVTHHTPSAKSIPPQFEDSLVNHWFCVPAMERYIVERKPAAWIHGHTHDSFDYRIGPTRVLCNPRGYPNEGSSFNPKFVVELP